MQTANRFPYTPATRWVSGVAFALCKGAGYAQLRMVIRAQNWYWEQLLALEAGASDTVQPYPVPGYGVPMRVQLAVAMIHVVAISPLVAIGGLVSLALLPCMVLGLAVWQLALVLIS